MINRTYIEHVEQAYQGEVYGEAMYTAIAESMVEPDHARKWRVMVELEIRIKAEMFSLVSRLGGDTREHESSRQKGIDDAQRYIGLPWMRLMEIFSRELDPVIAEYSNLEKGCPEEDARALRALTEHELVAKRFCELELAGKADRSIEPVLAFLAELDRR